ncbi:sugar kinase [Pseudovibrio denitrificans]|uniref:sugar kinase n=1 Tax=Pseudovibrio denitrificans TaxID=258256 RepID=UPI0039BF4692
MKIVALGECMIELAEAGSGQYKQGFAGDTFNTAVYLSRQFSPDLEVSYLTGLGSDSFSQAMRAAMVKEDIDTSHIIEIPEGQPGLYMVETDDEGERSFHYWRENSAARQMFAGWSVHQICECLSPFEMIYFSGISLAILDTKQQDTLMSALQELSGSTKIAFDPNFRARLWPNQDRCRSLFQVAASIADIALVTTDDHSALWQEDNPKPIGQNWLDWGAKEVVIKEGANTCIILNQDGLTEAPPPQKITPTDTTGAGDSFAAGYLGARLLGQPIEHAAKLAHGIAAKVIQHPGAIVGEEVWE